MKAEGRPLLHRDRAGEIVNRSARRAEQQHFGSRAEGIQEFAGFVKTDRCGCRADGDRHVTCSFPDSMPETSGTAAPRHRESGESSTLPCLTATKANGCSERATPFCGGSCHRFSFVRPRADRHVYGGRPCALRHSSGRPSARGTRRTKKNRRHPPQKHRRLACPLRPPGAHGERRRPGAPV